MVDFQKERSSHIVGSKGTDPLLTSPSYLPSDVKRVAPPSMLRSMALSPRGKTIEQNSCCVSRFYKAIGREAYTEIVRVKAFEAE
jgi:hypothetical protein